METDETPELERRVIANMQRLRSERGMSQADLAAKLGFHRQTLQKIESGGRPLRVGELQSIASALSVEVADLLEDAFTPTAEALANQAKAHQLQARTALAEFYRFQLKLAVALDRRESLQGSGERHGDDYSQIVTVNLEDLHAAALKLWDFTVLWSGDSPVSGLVDNSVDVDLLRNPGRHVQAFYASHDWARSMFQGSDVVDGDG